MKTLPEQSFYALPSTGETILIKRGEDGYYPQDSLKDRDVNELNEILGVTKGQAEAMFNGSMHGWHTKSADPNNFDEEGNWIK